MYTKKNVLWLALATVTLFMLGACASQGDVSSLSRRVYSLEQRNERLNQQADDERTRYREEQEDTRSKHASFGTVIEDLRDEMVQLRGSVEEAQYELQKTTAGQADLKRLEKTVQISLDRIVRIEEYLGLEPSEKLAPPETDREQPLEEGEGIGETPEELYRRAKELFDQGEYENARELFRSYVNQFPKSKLADNAQFWIGEIYYREKWYEKAILEYQKVIENYPSGSKTPGALLKQGFAFVNLNDKENARLILKELIRKFPDSNEAGVAKNKLAALQ
jgi:tol-pal system protein YbgF